MAPLKRLRTLAAAMVLALGLAALPRQAAAATITKVDLTSQSWALSSANGSIRATTTLPAYPLEVLPNKGVIPDPFFRYGETNTRWVALETWTFSLSFDGSTPQMSELRAQSNVLLRLSGLDTFATVNLNGVDILSPNNFHRTWFVNVKDRLVGGTNTLTVKIKGAAAESSRLKSSYPYSVPFGQQMGMTGAYNFARKPGSDFGWDWNPNYAVIGIFGSVDLLGFTDAVLDSAWVSQRRNNNNYDVTITSRLFAPQGGDRGTLAVSIPALSLTNSQAVAPGMSGSNTVVGSDGVARATYSASFSVPASSVDLWWPKGYGKQALYDVKITYESTEPAPSCSMVATLTAAEKGQQQQQQQQQQQDGQAQQGAATDTAAEARACGAGAGASSRPNDAAQSVLTYRLGFRTIELVRKTLDQAASDLIPAGSKAWSDGTGPSVLVAGPAANAVGSMSPHVPSREALQAEAAAIAGGGARPAGDSGLQDEPATAALTGAEPQWVSYPLPEGVSSAAEAIAKDAASAAVAASTAADGNGTATPAAAEPSQWWWGGGGGGGGGSATGESFFFRVNGVNMFMKGANMVPLTTVHSEAGSAAIADIMDYAIESNMNMLRVWGGGYWPREELLNVADERGVLIWMEGTFACSPYPADAAFLANVRAEVRQVAERASWHPAVAAWSGNNEVEQSFDWYSETSGKPARYVNDYTALFVSTIRAALREVTPGMPYVDSSPSNGVTADTDTAYTKRWGNTNDAAYGDVHFYNYDMDCEQFSNYPKAKFISEFGSQSLPTIQTWGEVTDKSDWTVGGSMMGFRNRKFGSSTSVMTNQMSRHFKLPSSWTSSAAGGNERLFRDFVYLSGMQQARCYETAMTYWRRLRAQRNALTMGILFWQLNDPEPYASWSGYDSAGRWKPLAYAAKRVFAPLSVQLYQDGSTTKVFAVNDHAVPVVVSGKVRVLSLADTTSACPSILRADVAADAALHEAATNASLALAARSAAAASSENAAADAAAAADAGPVFPNANSPTEFVVTVPASFAKEVFSMATSTLLQQRAGCTSSTCYAAAVASTTSTGEPKSAEAQMLFVAPKSLSGLADPQLTATNFAPSAARPGGVDFTLRAQRPAVLTQLQTGLVGRFSDDAATVHPCFPKALTFTPKPSAGPVTPAQLQADLKPESLWDHSRF